MPNDDLARLGAIEKAKSDVRRWRAIAKSHAQSLTTGLYVTGEVEDLDVEQIRSLAEELAGAVGEIKRARSRLADLGGTL